MHPKSFPVSIEPTQWNVVFHPTAATPWMNRVPIGRFKHVSAFAYLAGIKGWLVYDVQLDGTRLVVLPDIPESMDVIGRLTDGCDIISMRRGDAGSTGWRLGFWCVPAIKHLIGLRSGALRPDALRRDCLRNGGEIVHETPRVQAAGRSDA
ncbi:MAG: hypothetical protein JWQ01_4932 [Massilia sp.]|nr:hypothetical protein [Massilia sp.]